MIQFPRKWLLYDFTDSRGQSIVSRWAEEKRIDDDMRAKVDVKLDLLAKLGPDLPPGLLAGTSFRNVDKLRIFGKRVTWRFMICRGPINPAVEFTIIYIAQERNRKLVPKNADELADNNRKIIIDNVERRRKHERLGAGTN
jgi:hypothetical protein